MPIMEPKMIFFRIGWMQNYSGLNQQDQITGGGGFIDENQFGHEIFNFQPYENNYFGYVQPVGTGNDYLNRSIYIPRLGAGSGDPSIDKILVIYFAKKPNTNGHVIVGWYKDATVFRTGQHAPEGSNRFFNGTECGYYCSSPKMNGTLLTVEERTFEMPIRGNGGPGQSNVWFADDEGKHLQSRQMILNYINGKLRGKEE